MAKRHRKNQSKRTKTKAGYWVQSYSEAKIDNWFFKQKLNYVYEPVFWLGENASCLIGLSYPLLNLVLIKASLLNTGGWITPPAK